MGLFDFLFSVGIFFFKIFDSVFLGFLSLGFRYIFFYCWIVFTFCFSKVIFYIKFKFIFWKFKNFRLNWDKVYGVGLL